MEKFDQNSQEQHKDNNEMLVSFERKEGTAGVFDMTLEGQKIGKFTLFDPERMGRKSDVKVKQIGYVNIDDAFRGKGLGKQFYIKLNDYINEQDGSLLESGDDTTGSADRVWNSLLEDGLVIKTGTTVNGKDSFRFKVKTDMV